MRSVQLARAAVLMLAACATSAPPAAPVASEAPMMAVAKRIATTSAQSSDVGWQRLTDLTDLYGPRITGSPALQQALDWAAQQMRADGLDNVRLEPVQVPHWVRGAEHARIVQPIDRPMAMLGLGGSVGTRGTLRAPVVGFDSLDALRASDERLDGRIAFVNHRLPPFDHARSDPGYRQGVQARLHAASEAAKRGARAVLVRSVTAVSLRTPHTGALIYAPRVAKIPAAAVSIEDADLLARLLQRGPVEVELALGAHVLPDAPSANAIGELRGRERPDEIVLLGAHIDTWDVGQGASDDGGGCVAVMEALRLLKRSGLTPRRTVRVVLFTGEEYGLAGARAYRERHGGERHVAAFETDFGMGAPDAIGVGNEARVQAMAPLRPAFARFDIRRFLPHAYGADVEPIVAQGAAPYDIEPDGSHYFDIHHTAADTLDKLRPEDLRRNAAAIALLAYVLAEE
jgi:Zn-dependent M28 family amino/carboxypeptidase